MVDLNNTSIQSYLIFSWKGVPKGGMNDLQYGVDHEGVCWQLVAEEICEGKEVQVLHWRTGHVWHHEECVSIVNKNINLHKNGRLI